jgi:uncharacterized protein (DUF4415 family)
MSENGTTKRRLGEGLENDRTDWERLRARSDAEIAEAIRNDPDTIDPGEEWLRSVAVPPPAVAKAQLTVRLDRDMVDWFRRQGRGYQTRMNAVLRSYYEAQQRGRRRG